MICTVAKLAVICVVGAGIQPGIAAATSKRPDLKVSAGSVAAGGGKLSGSVTIRNAGRGRAPASRAELSVLATRKIQATQLKTRAIRRSRSVKLTVDAQLPAGVPAGSWKIEVCADSTKRVRERRERNNCRDVGSLTVTAAPQSSAPASSIPTDPIAFTKDAVFTINGPATYWVYVPQAYDATHNTPSTLLIWLHGCGGFSSGDISTVSPGGSQSYISVAVGGREGGCWDVNADPALVLATLANVKTHFNIAPKRVVIGGYSSGGDLAYRTTFYNSGLFAGLLAENTSPFRDTGSSQAASLAAATWKFNVVHLAHTGDLVYPLAGVRSETDAMAAAGFPITRIERAGTHYDPDAGASGTDYDLRTYLLPHLDDGWHAP